MILRRIKHMLFRLSIEEKVLGLGALTVFVGTFLPWYATTFNFNEQTQVYSGFAGDLGVVGFIIFLFNVMAIAFLTSEYLSIKIPSFGYKKEQILLFLSSQSAFLLLVTIAVYTKRSLDFTNSSIRFGLYMSLIGACIGAFAAFAQIKKTQKKDVDDIFDHSEESKTEDIIDESEDNIIEDSIETPIDRSINDKKTTTIDIKPAEEIEQKSFFYEEENEAEETVKKSIADTVEDKNEFIEVNRDSSDDDIQVDNLAEDKNHDLSEENINTKVNKNNEENIDLEIDKPHNQQDYFMRDAGLNKEHSEELIAEKKEDDVLKNNTHNGTERKTDLDIDTNKPIASEKNGIKVDMDSVKVVEKSEDKKRDAEKTKTKEVTNQSMDFYDDL